MCMCQFSARQAEQTPQQASYLLKKDRRKLEVEESLANLEALYKKLIEKHEEYKELVEGEEFTAGWLTSISRYLCSWK